MWGFKMDISFDEWFEELQELSRKLYGMFRFYIHDNNKEEWIDYYNDGYTPKDAYYEDISYGYN